MPTVPAASRMSLNYKTIRCRFFDDNGQPKRPSCPLGSRCNFIHPADPHWNKGKGANNTNSSKLYAQSPSEQRKRYHSPLVSQHDLFLSCNPTIANVRKSPRSRRQDSGEASEVGSIHAERPKRDVSPFEDKTHNQPLKTEQAEPFPPLSKDANVATRQISTSISYHSEETERKQRTDKASQLFRTFAKLSSQVVENTLHCNQEERKLRKYSEISSQLSAISPSITCAVSETLSDIITKHAHFKQLVERDIKAQAEVWEELHSTLIRCTMGTIDRILDDLKVKGEHICRDMLSQTVSSLKTRMSDTVQTLSDARKSSTSSRESSKRRLESEFTHPGRSESRERKRQRTQSQDNLAIMKQQLAELKAENMRLKDAIAEMDKPPTAVRPFHSALATSKHYELSPVADSNADFATAAANDTMTELQTQSWPSFSTVQMDFLRRLLDEHLPTQRNVN